MTRLGAENWLAAGAVWASIMLPNAAFGGYDATLPAERETVVIASAGALHLTLRNDRSDWKMGA